MKHFNLFPFNKAIRVLSPLITVNKATMRLNYLLRQVLYSYPTTICQSRFFIHFRVHQICLKEAFNIFQIHLLLEVELQLVTATFFLKGGEKKSKFGRCNQIDLEDTIRT